MNASTITVSNGQEFYRIPVTDLAEAKQDGFYVPAEKQRTIVSDGTELFEVPLSDVAEAEADGFHDILVGERAAVSDLEATAGPHVHRPHRHPCRSRLRWRRKHREVRRVRWPRRR